MVFRRHLSDLLTGEPQSVSALARALGLRGRDIEDDLRHLIRSARARGEPIEVIPASCRACGFTFGEDRLARPGRCPACREARIFEPLLRRAGSTGHRDDE
jgi:transcriptional regulator